MFVACGGRPRHRAKSTMRRTPQHLGLVMQVQPSERSAQEYLSVVCALPRLRTRYRGLPENGRLVVVLTCSSQWRSLPLLLLPPPQCVQCVRASKRTKN